MRGSEKDEAGGQGVQIQRILIPMRGSERDQLWAHALALYRILIPMRGSEVRRRSNGGLPERPRS